MTNTAVYQVGSLGIQLYDCPYLNARISITQCKINKQRAKDETELHEYTRLKACLSCNGLGKQKDSKKPKNKKPENKKKCSSCRTWKTLDQFPYSEKIGRKKAQCQRCDEAAQRRRTKQSLPKPPKITFCKTKFTILSAAAVDTYNLNEYKYFLSYRNRGERYIKACEEREDGACSFMNKPTDKTKQCSARKIRDKLHIYDRGSFKLVPTKHENIFRLVEIDKEN